LPGRGTYRTRSVADRVLGASAEKGVRPGAVAGQLWAPWPRVTVAFIPGMDPLPLAAFLLGILSGAAAGGAAVLCRALFFDLITEKSGSLAHHTGAEPW